MKTEAGTADMKQKEISGQKTAEALLLSVNIKNAWGKQHDLHTE